MPVNNELHSRETILVRKSFFTFTDADKNEFKILATGPEEKVNVFTESLPLTLKLVAMDRADSASPITQPDFEIVATSSKETVIIPIHSMPEHVEIRHREESAKRDTDLTEEALAKSLVVDISLIETTIKPPFILHFEIDPCINASEPPIWYQHWFNSGRARIECRSNQGQVSATLQEWWVGYFWPGWIQRASTGVIGAGNSQNLECLSWYTGYWRVGVYPEGPTKNCFNITGDIYWP